jgi:hypothetical protein
LQRRRATASLAAAKITPPEAMANLTRKAFLQTMIGMPCLLVSGCASWFFETKQE